MPPILTLYYFNLFYILLRARHLPTVVVDYHWPRIECHPTDGTQQADILIRTCRTHAIGSALCGRTTGTQFESVTCVRRVHIVSDCCQLTYFPKQFVSTKTAKRSGRRIIYAHMYISTQGHTHKNKTY